MTMQAEILKDPRYVPLHNAGFVGLIDTMGTDDDICAAARVSYGEGTRRVSENRALIRYLMRHRHTSPFEMVELKFHLKMPIFVMRQHVRHRTASLNEYSGRYSVMSSEMYMPRAERFAFQSDTNKQGSGEKMTGEQAASIAGTLADTFLTAEKNYHNTLDEGLARELARIQMPLANYTELYWKIDLRNFFHYVKLRADSHAQEEIRDYADAMYALVKAKYPMACEAFEDYWQKGVEFSQQEMMLVKRIMSKQRWDDVQYDLRDDDALAQHYGLSKRELSEFKQKLDLE